MYCELHPHDVDAQFVRSFNPRGVILSGSHASATEADTARAPQAVFDLGVPVLGICYGMQTMAAQLGGAVEPGKVREFGYAEVRVRGHSKLLEGIQDRVNDKGEAFLDVWMSHGDKVTKLPPGFKLIAENPACPLAGMADETRRFYAVPSACSHEAGRGSTRRPRSRGAGRAGTCRRSCRRPVHRDAGRQRGGDLRLSGGVDSAVAAALIQGDRDSPPLRRHGVAAPDEATGSADVRETTGGRSIA